jgi:hypothetical protein
LTTLNGCGFAFLGPFLFAEPHVFALFFSRCRDNLRVGRNVAAIRPHLAALLRCFFPRASFVHRFNGGFGALLIVLEFRFGVFLFILWLALFRRLTGCALAFGFTF